MAGSLHYLQVRTFTGVEMTNTQCKSTVLFSAIIISVLFWGVVFSAFAAVTWTQKSGTFYWYKSGTVNKYPSTNPVDFTIPKSWVKQSDIIHIQCKSSGGTNRYYPQGFDCSTGQPVEVKCEAYACKDDFGWTFDLSKNSVLTCPMVVVTKEQVQLSYDGLQASGKCR